MLNQDYFYHGLLRKYVILFGTLFNEIQIERIGTGGSPNQMIKVPIAFGPIQKFLVRNEEDPKSERKVAIKLPRMSFDIASFEYDSDRKRQRVLPSTKMTAEHTGIKGQVPWNINFDLSIVTNTREDGLKVMEQIIPYFDPEWVVNAKILDEFPDKVLSIPIQMGAMEIQDTYEADYETRRVIITTLHFTMKAYFFGPTRVSKIIKIAFVDFYTNDDMQISTDGIIVQPGLTSDGDPTTDITKTIPYNDIEGTDDYGIVVTIRDEPR